MGYGEELVDVSVIGVNDEVGLAVGVRVCVDEAIGDAVTVDVVDVNVGVLDGSGVGVPPATGVCISEIISLAVRARS